MALLYPNLQDDQVTFIIILFAFLFEVWIAIFFISDHVRVARSHLEHLDAHQH